jgi:phosphohistidine phosphatase
MKWLILMRHAHAGWAPDGGGDADRALNREGREAAPAMARWLGARGLRPDAVLCSPALRTRQTVALMRDALPGLPDPMILPTLYLAPAETILAALATLPADVGTALLVGHEPGLTGAAQALAGAASPRSFPAAGLAVFEVAVEEWGDVAAGGARIRGWPSPPTGSRRTDRRRSRRGTAGSSFSSPSVLRSLGRLPFRAAGFFKL